MRWVIVAFIVVPFVELYLLLRLSRWIDFWPTVLLALATGWIGGALAKREGLRVWHAYRLALEQYRQPEEGIVEGLLVLVGGALLITPGVLTDVSGFLLVLPGSRKVVAAWLRRRIQQKIAVGFSQRVRGRHRDVASSRAATGARRSVIDTTGEDGPEGL